MDTGEFITVSATEDAATIAYKELMRQLEHLEAGFRHHIKLVHDTHHMHMRGGWQQCPMASCRYAREQLGEGSYEEVQEQTATNN